MKRPKKKPRYHPYVQCPHRKQVLRTLKRGDEVFRCTHVNNKKLEAVKDVCGRCGPTMWSCENCPGFDVEKRQFVYELEVTRPPLTPTIADVVPKVDGPLRVAFLTHGFHLGGAERWIISLCREFDRSRVVPKVVAVTNPHLISDIARAALPKDVMLLPSDQVVGQWSAVADLVIGWGMCDMQKNVSSRGVPGISVIHHGGQVCQFTRLAVKDAIDAGVALAGVNEVCANTLHKYYRPRMEVIRNGADEARVSPTKSRDELRAGYGILPGQKVVAHVGRVMSDKDVAALARAVATLPAEWLLLVCGPVSSVEDIGRLEQLANGRMRYLSPRDHIGDVLGAADVFALLSPSEAHPLAVTEAWLAGIPVVCTRLPWLQAIEDEHGGLCLKVDPRHDAKEVAAAIRRAATLQSLGVKAQRIARQHFTAAEMARNWERVLCGSPR